MVADGRPGHRVSLHVAIPNVACFRLDVYQKAINNHTFRAAALWPPGHEECVCPSYQPGNISIQITRPGAPDAVELQQPPGIPALLP